MPYSSGSTAVHHLGLHQQQQLQQQQLNGYLDVISEQHNQQQQQQRLYCGVSGKAMDAVTAASLAVSAAPGGGSGNGGGVAMLSPVDSGIGTELSLLEHAKQVDSG